ncbi:MAG: copper resistance protein B [Abditibacteriaceae bacterium]
MRNSLFAVLLLSSVSLCAPVLAQETPAPQTSLKTAVAESTFTDNSPGAHLIPGTKPNPLASPESLPGQGDAKVLLQPHVEMTTHYDHGVHDNASYSKTLFDLLEYRPDGANSDVRWDIERWQGGDYNRWWFKTEGTANVHSGDTDAEFQLLKSKLTSPYTEFQYGLRLETRHSGGSTVARPQAVVGFQALMPYNYDLESAIYVDIHGNISGEVKAEKDFKINQRLILQPRIQVGAALQQVDSFGIGSGLTDMSLDLRLRYEINRQFAPYIVITYQKSFGKTASFVRQEGGNPSQLRFVTGVRMWF